MQYLKFIHNKKSNGQFYLSRYLLLIHIGYNIFTLQNNRLLIHWAALSGNENLVDFLIRLGSPVDPVDDTNCTPLILASSAGRFEVVRLLIGKGANVNHKSTRGQSSLHYACSKGHIEVIYFLCTKIIINNKMYLYLT